MLRRKITTLTIIQILFVAAVAFAAQICITLKEDIPVNDVNLLANEYGYQSNLFNSISDEIYPNSETKEQFVSKRKRAEWKNELKTQILGLRLYECVEKLKTQYNSTVYY